MLHGATSHPLQWRENQNFLLESLPARRDLLNELGTTYFLWMKNMDKMDMDRAWVSWGVTCTITQRVFVMAMEVGTVWDTIPLPAQKGIEN